MIKSVIRTVVVVSLMYASLTTALADQTHPELDTLFSALKKAETNTQAKQIESEIWEAWFEAPDETADLLMSQIAAAMSAGQHRFALQLSNQLVDVSPQFAEAWNRRATIQYMLGNHSSSVADIKETLILEPRHFGALSGLGLIFMASGNYEAALDAFDAVLEISPASDNAKGSVEQVKALIGREI